MRKLWWVGLVVMVLCFAVPTMAQNYSPLQAEVGYTLLHVTCCGFSATANGANADVFYNANHWLSLGGDFAGTTSNAFGSGTTIITYQFGPRIYFSRGTFQPFAQVLLGGVHISQGGASVNAFNFDLGGGVDIKVSQHFGVRPVELGYERFSLFGTGFNNLRYSAGINFYF
ncbi:MAG: hypothetical protein WA175_13895 [Candidatus Acidiferrales bacterium]